MTPDTTSKDFFDAKYRQVADPWDFASSPYEQGRYDAILKAISHRRYRSAFEPGCSVGVLTARLAAVCNEVHAMDISPTAVQAASMRCKHLPNVQITCGELPDLLPAGSFDLIVFSEIGYYLQRDHLHALAVALAKKLSKDGVLLAAHWLGASKDHILTGDQVHETLGTITGFVHEHAERHPEFRLDRWVRT
jgi:SAM-dependent methyltransferase